MASKINLGTEKTFRQALYAAIKNDEAKFDDELGSFTDPSELIAACARATDVSALIIVEQYQGEPTVKAFEDLVEHLAPNNTSWCGVSAADLLTFLKAMRAGTPVEEVLPTAAAIRVPFVLAGHLLVQFHKPDETWFDYLDRLWEALEDRP